MEGEPFTKNPREPFSPGSPISPRPPASDLPRHKSGVRSPASSRPHPALVLQLAFAFDRPPPPRHFEFPVSRVEFAVAVAVSRRRFPAVSIRALAIPIQPPAQPEGPPAFPDWPRNQSAPDLSHPCSSAPSRPAPAG